MGDVVNRAAKLAAEAGKPGTAPIPANSDFHRYLNDENEALFDYDWRNDRYTSWAVMTQMDNWASA